MLNINFFIMPFNLHELFSNEYEICCTYFNVSKLYKLTNLKEFRLPILVLIIQQ